MNFNEFPFITIKSKGEYSFSGKKIEAFRINSSFKKVLSVLNSKNLKLPDLSEFVQLMVVSGYGKKLFKNSTNYLEKGVVFIPKDGIYIVNPSPILLKLEESFRAHEKEEEFFLDKYFTKSFLESKESYKFDLNKRTIPFKDFFPSDLSKFLFCSEERVCFDSLKKVNCKEISFSFPSEEYLNSFEQAFCNQLSVRLYHPKDLYNGGKCLSFCSGGKTLNDSGSTVGIRYINSKKI